MPKVIRRILVATDFSECSNAALERADDIARSLGATVDVIHTWNYAPVFSQAMAGSGPPEDARQRTEEAAKARLERFISEATEGGVGIRKALLRRGNPAAAVVRAAEEGPYDMIVAGTHGRVGAGGGLVTAFP